MIWYIVNTTGTYGPHKKDLNNEGRVVARFWYMQEREREREGGREGGREGEREKEREREREKV